MREFDRACAFDHSQEGTTLYVVSPVGMLRVLMVISVDSSQHRVQREAV